MRNASKVESPSKLTMEIGRYIAIGLALGMDGGTWQDYTTPIVIGTDTDTDGTVYQFKAKSASGVWSDAVSITVKRDTIAPVISGVVNAGEYHMTQD